MAKNEGAFLCWECVGDEVLRQWIRHTGNKARCSFCGKSRIAAALPDVSRKIDGVIRSYYEIAKETAHFSPESDNPQYYAEGETAIEVIGQIALVEPDVSTAIDEYLSGDEERAVRDGDEPFYDGAELNHIRTYSDGFMDVWDHFEYRLKHEVRFFDDAGRKMLDSLIGDIGEMADGKAIVTIEPEGEWSTIFRARLVDDRSILEDVIKEPARHLGPPPPEQVKAGRMNPAGIPAFYGAFAADVAVAEVRPPVGGRVAVGKFKLLKSVKLLDMSVLPYGFHNESIFSHRYDDARNKVSFLRRLHRRISRPVLPSDETLAYLPTQAVAAYVSNVLNLDGVIYGSLQVGAEGDEFEPVSRDKCNVALFGKAAKVQGAEPKFIYEDEFPPIPASSFGPFPGLRAAVNSGASDAPPATDAAPNPIAPAASGDAESSVQASASAEGTAQKATANSVTTLVNEFTLGIEAKVELFDVKSVAVGIDQVYFHEYDGEVHLSEDTSYDDDE
jgi:RES domain/HEPN/RES N-terminal domain 1